MHITYYGHSCFKLADTQGTVLMDPFDESVGFALPRLSADVVTVSHDHADHNAYQAIKGTARRQNPFIIKMAGEYEVQMISVFGVETWHDATEGAERGPNTVYTVYLDGIRVCHLGDLGHELTAKQREAIGDIDVLMVPVGGQYTIDAATAVKVVRTLEPAIVIPMHYQTAQHEPKVFGELSQVDAFLKAFGAETTPVAKLTLSASKLPEETEVVVLEQS